MLDTQIFIRTKLCSGDENTLAPLIKDMNLCFFYLYRAKIETSNDIFPDAY
jgi:hypothetical protein